MAEALRIGVLGLTHDHVWGNLADLQHSTLGKLVAASDVNEPLLEKIRSEFDCPQTYQDSAQMFADVALDAVYLFGDNAGNVDAAVTAAEHGLHLLVEKPMASTFAGAMRMMAAARANDVKLMVNWPFCWLPTLQHAMTMALNGDIGELFSVRYRAAHAGPKELGCTPYFYNWLHDADLNGAGALMDYCCYGVALARRLLGQPNRVTGVAGHLAKDYITLEDNAVLIMQWPRAMALSEASWTQIGHLTSYVAVIYGSEGTLVVERAPRGRLLLATREHDDGVEVEVPPLPDHLRSATNYFLDCIHHDKPIEGLSSAEVGRDAQEILEAGIRSAATNQAVSLPLPAV